jgi:co-chaperonin GroES (HSP10)
MNDINQEPVKIERKTTEINYQPLGYTVVIELPEKESKTKGGIIVPEQYQRSKTEEGMKVVAIGYEVQHIDVGDIVILDVHPQTKEIGVKEVLIDGKVYAQLTKHQIVGKLLNTTR